MLLDPRHYRLDELLRRPYTPLTPFGSTGECLWATSPQGWGFREGVHWVHKTGERGLAPFTLDILADGEPVEVGDAIYRPSYVTLHGRHEATGLQVTEDKFITKDDVVVSVVSLRNPGEYTADVTIDFSWGVPAGEQEFRSGIPVYVHRHAPPGDDLHLKLPPDGRRTLIFAVAFSTADAGDAARRARYWATDETAVLHHAEAYQEWFDRHVPRFDCSDPWLTKMWYHRWYVVKKNHSRPRAGLMQEDTFAEGRWDSTWYTATITYGAGHALREARWLRDPEYARNYFRGFARSQREDGLYRSFYVDGIARPDADEGKYTDWITAAVYDLHLVHPDRNFLAEALPALEKNVRYWQGHSWENDGLLVVDDHWWTGMEWQPSFFYKADYRLGERRDGRDVQNPVKRLDLTSYQYANVRALAAVQRLLGNETAARRHDTLAEEIRAAVRAKMWDDETGFFYDVLTGTDEKIKTAKTVAAFYPFYAGMPAEAGTAARAWAHLTDPAEFWTPYPPASTAADSPAYDQEMRMRDKPVTSCYWNGPTWPHANSLVISGLARSLREHGEWEGGRKTLLDLVNSFARAQYEDGDYQRPHTGEFYRGDTARWLTRERDYHHSTWADLIVSALIGLTPREDDVVEVHPLMPPASEGGWTHFCLEDVPYHGRLLTLVWDDPAQPEDVYNDGDRGFTVYADGKRLHHQEDLSPCAIPLPPANG